MGSEEGLSQRLAQPVTILDVLQHVRTHLFPAWPGRRCIDGRYQPGQASGRLARPGADLGYVLLALAACRARGLTIPATEVADAVIAAVTTDGDHFAFHTDDSFGIPTDSDGGSIPKLGCRHVAAALDPERRQAYFPDGAADAAVAVRRIIDRWRRGDRIEIVTVHGPPRETDVLVVTGTQRTVEPGRAGYFVIDEMRDRLYMFNTLAPRLLHLGIDYDDLWLASRRQCLATLRIVAPSATAWKVNCDGAAPTVETLEGAFMSTPFTLS